MKKNPLRQLVFTAFFIALCTLLPMLFHAFGMGSVFLPMHIPVFCCSLLVGWKHGALCGLTGPLISSLLTGMPPLFPVCACMLFELTAYGAFAGLLQAKRKLPLYPALIGSMLAGRCAGGIASAAIYSLTGIPYSFQIFLSSAFLVSWPGILIQLAVIPALCLPLRRLSRKSA